MAQISSTQLTATLLQWREWYGVVRTGSLTLWDIGQCVEMDATVSPAILGRATSLHQENVHHHVCTCGDYTRS